jgi:hypothetical protein
MTTPSRGARRSASPVGPVARPAFPPAETPEGLAPVSVKGAVA